MRTLAAVAAMSSLVGLGAAQSNSSVLNGVYTEAQALRGKTTYVQHCARCHGEQSANPQNPLWGERFGEHWEAHTLADLFRRIRDTMPPGGAAPTVDVGDKLDALAFILQQNEFPAGNTPLTADDAALATIQITGRNGPIPIRTGTLVRLSGCLARRGEREWQLTSATEPARATLSSQPNKQDQLPDERAGSGTVALLNPYPSPEAHVGHRVRVTGFLVRNGDADTVNVVSLEMIAATCQ